MAVVVARVGATLDFEQLIRHCEPRLAYFAVPRYLEVLDELPLTPRTARCGSSCSATVASPRRRGTARRQA